MQMQAMEAYRSSAADNCDNLISVRRVRAAAFFGHGTPAVASRYLY